MKSFRGQSFYKMTGSGNDFVFFDGRAASIDGIESPDVVRRICARGVGVGADGVVYLFRHPNATVGIRYYNADGSRADLCGNATLCTTNLVARLGGIDPSNILVATDSGVLRGRIRDGTPEFDLPPVTNVHPDYQAIQMVPDELHLGYATVGVPHIVIHVNDVANVDLVGRGRPIRYDPSLPHGANVNFVSKGGGAVPWIIRTYERGVEGETLACGTGNVATAVLLQAWNEAGPDEEVGLMTRSGLPLRVRLRRDVDGWHPTLLGEGRLVFTGELQDL